jgi:thymidylate synthase
MVCSAWNPLSIPDMALPPCHVLWQVLVIGERLHLNWYQRSADWFLGVPFNMASYALLASLLSAHSGIAPGIVTGFFGDTHLYENQFDGAREILRRSPRPCPRLDMPPRLDVLEWTHKDVRIEGYDPHPAIKVDVVV